MHRRRARDPNPRPGHPPSARLQVTSDESSPITVTSRQFWAASLPLPSAPLMENLSTRSQLPMAFRPTVGVKSTLYIATRFSQLHGALAFPKIWIKRTPNFAVSLRPIRHKHHAEADVTAHHPRISFGGRMLLVPHASPPPFGKAALRFVT